MRSAERHRKFITDLLSQSARLRKTQMVRVAGLSAADEAGLSGHKAQVLLVPQPFGLRQGQHTFVDAGAGLLVRGWRIKFGWRVVVIRYLLQAGEPGLKGLPDPVAIFWRQGVCLWPGPECPGIQIVLESQPFQLGQQLIPQDRRGFTRQDGCPVTVGALAGPWNVFAVAGGI